MEEVFSETTSKHGLCKIEHLYHFFACQGIHDMFEHGGNKILAVIPQLVVPIKSKSIYYNLEK